MSIRRGSVLPICALCDHMLSSDKSNKSGGSRYFPAFPFLFILFPKTASRVKEAIILVLCASHNVYHSADGNHVSKSISQGILLSCLNLPFSILPEPSSPIMSRLPHSIESTPSHYNLLPPCFDAVAPSSPPALYLPSPLYCKRPLLQSRGYGLFPQSSGSHLPHRAPCLQLPE